MRRRQFIAGVSAATAWPLAAAAQQSDRTYRIAALALNPTILPPFFDQLKRNGLVEGRNLIVDRRGLGVPVSSFDAVAVQLVKTAPDAIVTFGPPAGHAVQHATKSIPIVTFTDDPVDAGLVASASRPGGNTTGVGIFSVQLDAKRLEILHEIVPQARRIGILAGSDIRSARAQVEAAGRELGLELITQEVDNVDEIVRAIDTLAAAQVAAVNVLASPTLYIGRNLIVDRTRELHLPATYTWPEQAHEGGLVGFGPTLDEALRLLAQQVVSVLHGAAPAMLPILRPTRFTLAINLETAKALGLTVPSSLLAQANEVIE
jgi:putative tryptophan/tyrosine transport system substrate-binding protein